MASTAVREKPILFSSPMVRAILDGRKTMTRRVMKPQPEHFDREPHWRWSAPWHRKYHVGPFAVASGDNPSIFGDYVVGDLLWVRESFRIESFGAGVAQIRYAADNARGNNAGVSDRKLPNRLGSVPSIHMPRHCSRLTLEITGVRVERLQDISEADAIAEGIAREDDGIGPRFGLPGNMTNRTAFAAFARLWDSINGKAHPWESNPWVWVVSFKVKENSDG